MVNQRQAQRRGRVLGGVRPTSEDHRATPLELFFDLVYVFAVNPGHRLHGGRAQRPRRAPGAAAAHPAVVDLVGLPPWLGNQARADEGVLRAGMVVAMAAMFVVALTIPEAWQDAPGGLNGPLVLVGAYLLVHCVHLTVYAVAATGDPGLRQQVAITWLPMLAGGALLVAGALLGGWTQTLLFAGALLVEGVGVYLTSRRGNWRLHSVAHLTERHGLFLILAIGGSVVAIGVGAAEQPISAPLLVAAILGVAAAVCLWWLYFDRCRWRPSTDWTRREAKPGSTWPWRPTPMGTSRSWPASCSPPWASKACWPTPVSASPWAPSTHSRSSAASRCTWPGSCCSSAACIAC
jgi:low temperature requirement protein LtrA